MNTKGTFSPRADRRTLFAGASAAATLSLAACAPGEGADHDRGGDLLRAADPVEGEYIAILDEGLAQSADSVRALGGEILADYGDDAELTRAFERTIAGFAASMSPEAARDLAGHPGVRYVEENAHIELWEVQEEPIWNLDRVDQRELPLDDRYTYAAEGSGVTAYVIDTGIRTSHDEFEGRAREGYSIIDDDYGAGDCHGHGTHVAGTLGGAVWGVAKDVELVSVRVFNCDGRGATTAGIIESIEWVTADADGPAVANMSLGGPASEALDEAVRASTEEGVIHAVAAGNSFSDACEISPARVSEALTVGATAKSDNLAHFTNIGDCVDIMAPGLGIDSAGIDDDGDRSRRSGTSMASPHVAGAAALHLEDHPDAAPADVHAALLGDATEGVLGGVGDDWPNLLLYTGFIGGGGGDDGGAAARD